MNNVLEVKTYRCLSVMYVAKNHVVQIVISNIFRCFYMIAVSLSMSLSQGKNATKAEIRNYIYKWSG